jgi:hypothetical protein
MHALNQARQFKIIVLHCLSILICVTRALGAAGAASMIASHTTEKSLISG